MVKADEDNEDDQNPGAIPGWSWLTASVGSILVVGSAGFMLNQSFTAEKSPPKLVIKSQAALPGQSGYLVQILVENVGNSVAAEVVIEGELKEGAETVETSTITIDYVPSKSQRKAGLFFKRDPGKFDLQICPKGYVQP